MTGSGQTSPANGPDVLSDAMRRCRRAFLTIAAFSAIINLLMLAPPIYMLQVYDRVLSSGRTETLLMLTLIVAACIALLAALEALRTMLSVRVGSWLNESLGASFFESGVRARLEGDSSGSEVFRDLNQLHTFIG